MTTATAPTRSPATPRNARSAAMDYPPLVRWALIASATIISVMALAAVGRAMLGLAPEHSSWKSLAVMIHVITVVPAAPLGLYILIARKGSPLHKQLGRIWVMLMIATAMSAIFIRHVNHGDFSLIHLFVPMTIIGAVRSVHAARTGRIDKHRFHLAGLYFGGLFLAGLFSFAGDRMMGAWLFG